MTRHTSTMTISLPKDLKEFVKKGFPQFWSKKRRSVLMDGLLCT
jgi:hypothetical protein